MTKLIRPQPGIFTLVLIALLLSNSWTAALKASDSAKKPNVIFILADDLGWADTTLYGHTRFYQTPNIQRLAERGMTFTRAYSASPLCSPTRSAILTGLSPARTGITTPNCHLPQVVLTATVGSKAAANQKSIMPAPVTRLKTEYRTLAESLKEAGYATAHFGKWHLGADPYSALQQGFDVDIPHHPGPGPAGSYLAPWNFTNFKEKFAQEHIEDRLADEAAAWIEAHQAQPFYLNYWMFSVHGPWGAKERLIEKYRQRIEPQDDQRNPVYAAMIESMDDAVGKLIDTLDRLQLSDNTILVFTSDNGGNMYSEVEGSVVTSNRPLRGGKACMYEGGTRVPAVIVWPGVASPGSRCDQAIQSEDYYPTLLEGLKLSSAADQQFDGTSILPALRGQSIKREAIFQYFPHNPAVPDWLPPSVSIHSGDWKLIRIFHGGDSGAHRYLLYNLNEDLGEQNNLATARPDLVERLDLSIEQFLKRTRAVVPIPNPAFDPSQYDPALEGKGELKKGQRGSASAKNVPKNSSTNENDPALKGWKVRGSTAAIENGVLRVFPQSDAPFLGFAPGPLDGPAKLRFRIRCDGGEGKVAWISNAANGAIAAVLPNAFLVKAGDWVEISVDIPAPKEAPGIVRLFLPPGQSAIEIDWIELHSDRPVRRWDF